VVALVMTANFDDLLSTLDLGRRHRPVGPAHGGCAAWLSDPRALTRSPLGNSKRLKLGLVIPPSRFSSTVTEESSGVIRQDATRNGSERSVLSPSSEWGNERWAFFLTLARHAGSFPRTRDSWRQFCDDY
jgi:hypothetical protein